MPSTVVVSTPVCADISDECSQKFPHVFPCCAVTRAREKQLRAGTCVGEISSDPDNENDGDERILSQKDGKIEDESVSLTLAEDVSDSSDMFMEESFSQEKVEDLLSPIFHVSRETLVQEQSADETLKPLFSVICVEDHETKLPSCYFLKEGLLLRR